MSQQERLTLQLHALLALNIAAELLALVVLMAAAINNYNWQFWLALALSGVMQFRMTTGLWVRAFLKGGER